MPFWPKSRAKVKMLKMVYGQNLKSILIAALHAGKFTVIYAKVCVIYDYLQVNAW